MDFWNQGKPNRTFERQRAKENRKIQGNLKLQAHIAALPPARRLRRAGARDAATWGQAESRDFSCVQAGTDH